MVASFINIATDVILGPAGLAPIQATALRGIERRLGYFGQDRYVCFHYEPRGEEVIWRDSRSYGFGTGAWIAFLEEIVPLAGRHHVNVGDERSSGSHVLLIDRVRQRAYFGEHTLVKEFLGAVARTAGAALKGVHHGQDHRHHEKDRTEEEVRSVRVRRHHPAACAGDDCPTGL